MRLLICVLILLAGCSDIDGSPERAAASPPLLTITGRLGYKSLDEASGIARSLRDDTLLWVINDDGPSDIYGIGLDGSKRGKVEIRKAANRDWEDIATFWYSDKPYLLIADIGDNNARRKDVTIYVVEEPDPEAGKIDVAWEFDFTYPDGPRDAEAVAVDAGAERILVLSKRDIPARLYGLPLRPDSDKRLMAEFLGPVDTLPQPTRMDVNAAPITDNWHWQPTSMTIAADDRSALVLTYSAIYYYRHPEGEAWETALRRPPLGLSLRQLPRAEAITLGASGDFAYITREGRDAPLIRVDLRGNGNYEATN